MKAARRNTQRVNWDQMWIQESRFFSPGHEMLWEIPNMWGWKCFSLALAFFLLPTLWSSTRLVGRRRTSYFTASTWHLLEAEGKQLREWRSLFPFFIFLFLVWILLFFRVYSFVRRIRSRKSEGPVHSQLRDIGKIVNTYSQ